jgi:hypothetical protein
MEKLFKARQSENVYEYAPQTWLMKKDKDSHIHEVKAHCDWVSSSQFCLNFFLSMIHLIID